MYRKTRGGFAFLSLFVAFCIWLLTSVDIPYGMDLRGGTELRYELDLSQITENRAGVAAEVKDIIQRRLDSYGLKELSIAIENGTNLVVQLPGSDADSVKRIKKQIENAGALAFHIVAASNHQTPTSITNYRKQEDDYLRARAQWVKDYVAWEDRKAAGTTAAGEQPPKLSAQEPKYVVRKQRNKDKDGVVTFSTVVLENDEDQVVDGSRVDSSKIAYTMGDNGFPAVAFSMKSEGAAEFGDLTGRNTNRNLAIVLDGVVQSAPNIRSKISNNGTITGDFSDEEVKDLITTLRGGSLEAKPIPVSESTVGSVLGQESVAAGIQSVVIGLICVILFIGAYYLAAGIVANFAVLFNILVVLTYVATFRQDLTLPGIAGILLTIGMAVDANILIFERVREERSRGKGLLQALATGYQRAFSVIFDANLTTVITGIVLFKFGTGPVKGFAVTLIAGIIISFVSALFVTRLFLSFALNKGLIKELKMASLFATPSFKFSTIQKPFLAMSVVVIALTGTLVLFRGSENYGIDFTGGARIQVRLKQPLDRAKVDELLDQASKADPDLFAGRQVQTVGDADANGNYSQFVVMTRAGAESSGNVADAQGAQPAPEAAKPVEGAAPTPAPAPA
ncbi:MAG: protein translocase subunit SecD, partial [Planctomycetota bacterium]